MVGKKDEICKGKRQRRKGCNIFRVLRSCYMWRKTRSWSKGRLEYAEIKLRVSQASCLAHTHGPGTNIDDTNKVESGPIATPFLNGHINGGTPEIGVSQKLLKRRL